MQELVLFGTSGCHLCDSATDVVARAIDKSHVAVRLVEKDIADSDTLIDIYGIRIPVLRNEMRGIELDWPFGEDQVLSIIVDNK